MKRVFKQVSLGLLCFFVFSAPRSYAGENEKNSSHPTGMAMADKLMSRISIRGYGTINYHGHLQNDLDPNVKKKLDMEHFVLYFDYRFTDRVKLSSAFEYEHGGTGASMHYHNGHFEPEIGQGGEAKLERLFIEFGLHPAAKIRVGRFKLHMGLACSRLSQPVLYCSTTRGGGESLAPLLVRDRHSGTWRLLS